MTPGQLPMMQSQTSYPNTASPASGSYGINVNQHSVGGLQARAIHFDGSTAGYGNGQGASVAGAGGAVNPVTRYGSYNNLNAGGNPNITSFNSTNSLPNNVSSASSHSANPYQKKSGSGLSIKHILISLLVLPLLTLTGTSIYYRNIFKSIKLEVDAAREEATKRKEKHKKSRQEGRPGQGRNKETKRNIQKKQRKIINSNKEGNTEEKRQLEKAIEQLQSEIKTNQAHFNDLNNLHNSHTAMHSTLVSKKQDLSKALDHTENLLEDAKEEMDKYKAMVDGLEDTEIYMKKREGALWSRIDVLEGKIGQESWREAIEWFGPGPHVVEITLEYPKVIDPNADPSTWPRVRNKLHIEMAPLDLMPHAVNFFLQQVHHQLWDGCSFATNAKHIFQLGPSYDAEDKDAADTGGDPHYDRFHEVGLDKISYQEYSEQYPHGKWTVGMAGRPGGPDFYINKIDNSMIHGPGGQTNRHDLHNEADPCFGKIVMEGEGGGKRILDEIGLIPTDPGRNFEIKYPVVIIGAKVLAPKENPLDGWREIKSGEKLVQDEIMPLPKVPHGV